MAATSSIILTLTLAGCLAALVLTVRAGAPPTAVLVPGGFILLLAAAASFAAWTRPRNVIGWLLLAGALLEAVALVSTAYARAAHASTGVTWPLTTAAAHAGTWAWLPAVLLPLAVLPAAFPSGRAASRGVGALAMIGSAGVVAAMLRAALGPVDLRGLTSGMALRLGTSSGAATVLGFARRAMAAPRAVTPTATAPAVATTDVTASITVPGVTVPGVTALLASALGVMAVALLTSAIALQLVTTAVRVRRASFPLRQQLLLLLATVAVVCAILVQPVPEWLLIAALTLPGVAMAPAVVRRRLPTIAVFLNGAAYYVPLSALVALIVAAVSTLVGQWFPSGPLPLLAAAAVVAVTVGPLARSLRRAADRLVFGRRAAEPTSAPDRVTPEDGRSDDALASAVAAIADMVDAQYVAVESADGRTLAQYGTRPGPTDRVPLGRTGGALVVSHLPDATGRSVVDALAIHVASIVGAQRLTAKLEHSRKRAEASRAAERERIRQDMHDGLGPALSGISLSLQAAHGLVSTDPGAAQAVLVRARQETDAAVAEVRRVLNELRPVAMDGEDLAAAVRHTARSMGFGGPSGPDLDLVCDTFRLPPRVEDAAYRIVNEALHNVARHADAGRCEVTLSYADDVLVVRVLDDGRGLPADRTPGVGLDSMQHRARTAGGRLQISSPAVPGEGGTLVEARLPVQASP